MDTDPGIYLFVAELSSYLERSLNMDVWFESFFDVLMWICIFFLHRNTPSQKTPGPENHEDVPSESEAETETLPEVTEESLPSEYSEVSN